MTRLILIGLAIMFGIIGKAQEPGKSKADGKIAGKIIDSVSHKPVEYATITAYRQVDKKVVTGTIADNLGQFSITAVDPNIY